MDPNEDEDFFKREEEEIAKMPEGPERRNRQIMLNEARQMARFVDNFPGLMNSSASSEENRSGNKNGIYEKYQQEFNASVVARLMSDHINHPNADRQQTESDESLQVVDAATNQALSETEALAPLLRETRRRAERLVTELTNLINCLYHTRARNSAPDASTVPLAGRRALRGRSTTGERRIEPAGREVPRNAFYFEIRERMISILARAVQFRNSVPIPGNGDSPTLPTPESPSVVHFGDQASSFDYPSSLEGAVGSTPSQVLTPEDYDNNNLGESASVYRETDSFSSDVRTWSQNPNRRSRLSTEHRRSDWQRDTLASRSPPAKTSRSKVPTPLDKSDKKQSGTNSHKKTSKKSKVHKQTEKEQPRTPVKKTKSGLPKSSEKESSEKKKGKRKEDATQTSRSEQRSRNSSTYGARPKTSASSVWNEAAAQVWETTSSEPSLDVRMPVEESPSPSTAYTSVSHSPVGQSTLGNTEFAAIDNSLPTVNQPVDEFSRTYSSGQFALPNLPVRQRTTRTRRPSQSHCPGFGSWDLKSTSPPLSPSVNRPIAEDESDVGTSESNEASNIAVSTSALKSESPASTDNRPPSREIGAINEAREQRIANIRSPSHSQRDTNSLKLEFSSKPQRSVYKSCRRAVAASDEASRNKSTKSTASVTESISSSVPKGAASVPKGTASVSAKNLSKETSPRASKASSISRVPTDRNRIISNDGFRSISSKQSFGIPTKTGISTGAPQRSTIRGIEGASSTPSSKVSNVQRRVGGGISRANNLPFSLTKKTSCIQSPREINTSRTTASKIGSVRKKTSSAQSSETADSGKVSIPLADSAGMVQQETSTHSSEATAPGNETVASVPFAESTDSVPQETSSSQSSEATAPGNETVASVPFADSTDSVSQETSSSQSSEAILSEKQTSVGGQLSDFAKNVLKETSTQSSMVPESNNETNVAEGASGVDISNGDDSQALEVHVASRENEENGMQNILQILEACQIGESSEPAGQNNPDSRKSDTTVRRKEAENSPRKYHSV